MALGGEGGGQPFQVMFESPERHREHRLHNVQYYTVVKSLLTNEFKGLNFNKVSDCYRQLYVTWAVDLSVTYYYMNIRQLLQKVFSFKFLSSSTLILMKYISTIYPCIATSFRGKLVSRYVDVNIIPGGY